MVHLPMMNLDNMVNKHKDDQYLLKFPYKKSIDFIRKKKLLQGHVSNEPIFPTDESIKLYGTFIVLLKNSNVACGHPPKNFQ
jgi:hypothetical protein